MNEYRLLCPMWVSKCKGRLILMPVGAIPHFLYSPLELCKIARCKISAKRMGIVQFNPSLRVERKIGG